MMALSDHSSMEVTPDERRAIETARAAHIIGGGGPLVPYDFMELAREVVRLREALSTVRGWLDGDPDRWVPTAQQYIEAVLNKYPFVSDEERS